MAVLPVTAALAADPEPDIVVTASADKATYAEGDTVTITVTVKNKSSVDAEKVQYVGGDDAGVDGLDLSELSTGFDLAAGATRTLQLAGTINHRAWKYGSGFVGFELGADNGEANDEDNTAIVRLLVPGAFGDLSGRVFEGESIDDMPTPETPGVPGVKVVASSLDGKTKHAEAVTDAKGEFRLDHLPVGDILLTFTAPAGWKILAVDGDHTSAQIIGEEHASVSVVAKKVPVTSPSASASAPAGGAGGGLPVTGDNTPLLVGAGAVAVAIGVALAFVARRRRVQLQA